MGWKDVEEIEYRLYWVGVTMICPVVIIVFC